VSLGVVCRGFPSLDQLPVFQAGKEVLDCRDNPVAIRASASLGRQPPPFFIGGWLKTAGIAPGRLPGRRGPASRVYDRAVAFLYGVLVRPQPSADLLALFVRQGPTPVWPHDLRDGREVGRDEQYRQFPEISDRVDTTAGQAPERTGDKGMPIDTRLCSRRQSNDTGRKRAAACQRGGLAGTWPRRLERQASRLSGRSWFAFLAEQRFCLPLQAIVGERCGDTSNGDTSGENGDIFGNLAAQSCSGTLSHA
jgi:hypothetical protein